MTQTHISMAEFIQLCWMKTSHFAKWWISFDITCRRIRMRAATSSQSFGEYKRGLLSCQKTCAVETRGEKKTVNLVGCQPVSSARLSPPITAAGRHGSRQHPLSVPAAKVLLHVSAEPITGGFGGYSLGHHHFVQNLGATLFSNSHLLPCCATLCWCSIKNIMPSSTLRVKAFWHKVTGRPVMSDEEEQGTKHYLDIHEGIEPAANEGAVPSNSPES